MLHLKFLVGHMLLQNDFFNQNKNTSDYQIPDDNTFKVWRQLKKLQMKIWMFAYVKN